MGALKYVSKKAGGLAAPRIGKVAPGLTDGVLQKALDAAIAGAGPLDGAAAAADAALARAGGNAERATKALLRSHVRLAGAQGFLTNVGGVVTLAVTMPANVVGLMLVQLRLHAAIARLHGLDLADPGVRAAVLTTLIGHAQTEKLVRRKDLPGNAAWLAGGGASSPETTRRVAAQVAAVLVASLGGKQLASTVGKRIPLFGGVVGAATDARATAKLGREAARDLPRA